MSHVFLIYSLKILSIPHDLLFFDALLITCKNTEEEEKINFDQNSRDHAVLITSVALNLAKLRI